MAPPSSSSSSSKQGIATLLPPWAQVSSSTEESTTTVVVSLEEEELYLRTRAYTVMVHELEESLQDCIAQLIRPVVEQVQKFFDKYNTTTTTTTTTTTPTSTISSNTNNHNPYYSVLPPQQYNPRLLPCAVLSAPSHVSDQKVLIQSFASIWKQSSKRTAVVHIESTTSTTSKQPSSSSSSSSLHHWMEDIWRQCATQDSFTTTTTTTISMPRKRKTWSSQTNVFLQWASCTTNFDAIVIILDASSSQSSQSQLFADFMELLARLRREYGLLLQLILVETAVAVTGSITTTSTIRQCEVAVESFPLPSSLQVCDAVWHKWLIMNDDATTTDDTPDKSNLLFLHTLLSPHCLHTIHSSVQQYGSHSFTKTMTLLKQSLAWKLQQDDSSSSLLLLLLLMTNHEEFLQTEGRRLAWFWYNDTTTTTTTRMARTTDLTTKPTKPTMTGHAKLVMIQQQRRMNAIIVSSLLKALHSIIDNNGNLYQILQSLEEMTFMQAMAKHYCNTILRPMKKKQLFSMLKQIQNALMTMTTTQRRQCDMRIGQQQFFKWIGVNNNNNKDDLLLSSLDNPLQSQVDALNEFIILLDKATDDDDDEDQTLDFIWDSIQEWILGLFQQLSKTWKSLLLLGEGNDDYCADDDDDKQLLSVLLPQHRRQVATAIVNGSDNGDNGSDDEYNAATTLWNLISDLVAIPRYKWFQMAKKYAWQHKDEQEAWWLFSLGIYQLQYVGLIRPKQRGNRELIYEKAALVWSTTSSTK